MLEFESDRESDTEMLTRIVAMERLMEKQKEIILEQKRMILDQEELINQHNIITDNQL